MFNKVCLLAICIFLGTATSLSQTTIDSERTLGLSASLQGNQLDIVMPIWTSTHFVIAPSFGFASVEGAGSDYRFGLAGRYYRKNQGMSPFFGGRLGVLQASPRSGKSTTDLLAGILGGGEYFFDNSLSVGIEAQLNVSMSDEHSNRFGNPGGTNVNTAVAVFATVWF